MGSGVHTTSGSEECRHRLWASQCAVDCPSSLEVAQVARGARSGFCGQGGPGLTREAPADQGGPGGPGRPRPADTHTNVHQRGRLFASRRCPVHGYVELSAWPLPKVGPQLSIDVSAAAESPSGPCAGAPLVESRRQKPACKRGRCSRHGSGQQQQRAAPSGGGPSGRPCQAVAAQVAIQVAAHLLSKRGR